VSPEVSSPIVLVPEPAGDPREVLVGRGLRFSYGPDPVLDGVDLAVRAGEFVALVGPNGSGKSTLLAILLGLRSPAGGTVELFGHAPQQLTERWRVGYVPQRAPILEHLPATLWEVVASGCLARTGWARRLGKQDRIAVDHALESVALGHKAQARLGEVSGGEHQRALIARAMVNGPDLLVLDEPSAGIDAESQRRFRDSLVHMVEDHRTAVLLVSHELGAVAADLGRVVVLQRGRILYDGPPEHLGDGRVSLGIHRHDLPVWLEGLG